MNKTRRLFLTLPLVAAAMTAPALADPIPLSELSRYLNALQTAKGEFTQINGDGTISTGTIYIMRPGRIRFEYNPPDAALVMAGGGQVAIFDSKSNTGPEQYPLRRTPLSIILDRNVDLGRANMVVDHREDGVSTVVTAQDPEHPEYGNIQLVFTNDPVELRQWIITDDTGTQTTVVLQALQEGVQISSRLFNIPLEVDSRRRN
ncbi:LolA family protein [Aliiroseovarius sp. YM-037]|uniref:LolA family protein n=1 Tax=Aliiroseovarius sp. YM-037 TaxID=3341728 RepID=UPI003A80D246